MMHDNTSLVVQCLKQLTMTMGSKLCEHFDLSALLPMLEQHNHPELARHCFEVLLQHVDTVVADAALLNHIIELLSADHPAIQGYSLHIVTHYLVTRLVGRQGISS